MRVAIRPAWPNVRIRSDVENCKAMKDRAAVTWVKTQAGPTIQNRIFQGLVFVLAREQAVAHGEVSCILSEKLITMMSGVITLRKHIEAEI